MKSTFIYFGMILLFSLIISCNKKPKGVPISNTTYKQILKFKDSALLKGDTIAYNELSLDYMDSPNEGFLYTALIMANKYDFPQAYEDVYTCLTGQDHKMGDTELDDLDKKTRALALHYLILGAEKGNSECEMRLGKYYIEGKYVEKNVLKGKQLIKSSGN
jgi:TPR repeat protein